MKVNCINKQDISFNGLWENNTLKKGLLFAARNGTLFAGTTSLVLSSTVRPLAILATPKTEKKNKQIACAKSISSTSIGYLLMLAFSLPLKNSIEKIDKNPEKYINKKTIDRLKGSSTTLKASKAYSLATQLFKLGLGLFIAAPKAILTALCTPLILDKVFHKQSSNINEKEISFKGKNRLADKIGNVLNNKKFQDFSVKHKDSNFPMHIIAATDTLTTATFINTLSKNNKLEKQEKRTLMFNAAISTGLSILASYTIDSLTKESTDKIIEAFKKANKDDPKLFEYIEGIKIAKPILIMGIVYYMLIPIFSTFIAERLEKKDKLLF